MRSPKTYLLSSVILVVVALVLSLANGDARRAIADEFKDVRVINPQSMPANVRNVDGPARQPVHFRDSYTVPTGKRLMIEYISLEVGATSQCDLLEVGLFSGAVAPLHIFNPRFIGIGVGGPGPATYRYLISQEVRTFVDENSTASFASWSAVGCIPSLDDVGVSGYLVDLQ